MEDEDFEREWNPDDFELSEEDIAEIKRSIQDCNDGFTYEMMQDEDGDFLEKDKDGKRTFNVKCNKCNRIGNMMEKPFPHKYDCPMKTRFKD